MMTTSHSSLKVKVVEVCKVVPAPPPPSTTTTPTTTQISLPLTHFDYQFVRAPITPSLFFYENTSQVEGTNILSNLKKSLSLTLSRYLPLAGKLIWPRDQEKPIIQYVEGDGVSLTVAETPEAAFHHFTGNNNVSHPEDVFQLIPQLVSTHVETLALTLQVTFFGGQGYSVGCMCSHAVADGISFSMFIHDWATTCRKIAEDIKVMRTEEPLLNTPPPCYDRSNIYDTTNVGTLYIGALLDQDGPNNKSVLVIQPELQYPDLVYKRFYLSREDIDRLKTLIKNQWELGDNVQVVYPPLSTFTATVSYIWRCLVKSKNNDMEMMMVDKEQEFKFAVNFDVRDRLQPPLPSTNYFGNCVVQRYVSLNFHDLVKEDGVAMAAKAIAEEIQRVKDGGDAVLQKPGALNPELLNSPKGLLTTVSGTHRFQFYNADFGWGKPSKLVTPFIPHSAFFSLSDSRNGNGGIEVGISLRKPEMEIFSTLFARGLDDL